MADENWHCDACDYDNELSLTECESCGAGKPAPDVQSDDKFAGIVVGIVQAIDGIEGKDKLRKLKVDIGKETSLVVVTNAPNVALGSRVVVACCGSRVTIDGNEVTVKKTSVGGVMSEGMLCDAPMLGWTGGGAGTAALVPESSAPGSRPPETRPRLK